MNATEKTLRLLLLSAVLLLCPAALSAQTSYALAPATLGPIYSTPDSDYVQAPVRLTNYGSEAVESYTYTLYYLSTNETTAEQTVTFDTPLASGDSREVTFPIRRASGYGSQQVVVTIPKVNNVWNGTSVNYTYLTLYTVTRIPTKRVVVEDYTGMWCQYCPRGTVVLESLQRRYPADFIGIAIHGGSGYDPLANSSYGTSMTSKWVGGYPTLWANREENINDADGESVLLNQLKQPAPMAVEVSARWAKNHAAINIETVVEPCADAPEGQGYAVGYVLTADSLYKSGWYQANNASYWNNFTNAPEELDKFRNGAAYMTGLYFNHVSIAAMGVDSGIVGSLGAEWVPGKPITHTASFDNLLQYSEQIQSLEHLSVVALVMNTKTGRIANAAKCSIAKYVEPADTTATDTTTVDPTPTDTTATDTTTTPTDTVPEYATTADIPQDFKVDTLQYSGPYAINLVLYGDGYTQKQQQKFVNDVKKIYDRTFALDPFKQYQDYFNLLAIHVVSKDSGVSSSGDQRDTYFGLKKNYYTPRLIDCSMNQIFQLNRQLIPNYDALKDLYVIGVISNTTAYGGAGGMYLTLTADIASGDIYIHEFGHTFAQLNEEYWVYGETQNYATEAPNLTQETDSTKVRWKNWLGAEGIGIYQSGYSNLSWNQGYWYKPAYNCRMNTLSAPFCAVCRETIVERIHSLVNPIVAVAPNDTLVTIEAGGAQTFALSNLLQAKESHAAICWILDGDTLATDTTSLTLRAEELSGEEAHELTVSVLDDTPFVRVDDHAALHTRSHTWRVQATSGTPTGLSGAPTPRRVTDVYDLSGRRLHGTLADQAPGVYIVAGRKVVKP